MWHARRARLCHIAPLGTRLGWERHASAREVASEWPDGGQRDVAQLGSALDWGSRGRRFKSCHPDSVFAGQRAVSLRRGGPRALWGANWGARVRPGRTWMFLEPLWTSPWSRDRVCRRRARWTPWTHRSSGTTRRRSSTRRRTTGCETPLSVTLGSTD